MDDLDISASMVGAVELVLREIVVALVERGALDREDAARAYLRADITAAIHDEERALHTPCADYVRLLQQDAEARLGAKPEFHTLRRARERWREAGERGPDPYEPRGPAKRR